MPPSFDLGDDLSLRHLPDISDTSFSFQLPAASSVDLLLTDDAADFFQGADDSMLATPALARTAHQALTLSELTPKRQPLPHSFSGSSWAPQISPTNLSVEGTPKQTGRKVMKVAKSPLRSPGPEAHLKPHDTSPRERTPTREGSSTMARFETLKAEVEMLNDDLRHRSTAAVAVAVQEPPTRARGIGKTARARNLGVSKSKPTIATGGIVKTRSKNSKSAPTSIRHVPQPQRVELPEKTGSCDTAGQLDPDITISSPAGAVAERLVVYSQRLISSFRSKISSDIEPCPANVQSQQPNVVLNSVALPKDDSIGPEAPLTLSQISPRKAALPEAQTSSTDTPMSPLRTSSKRPASAARLCLFLSGNLVHKRDASSVTVLAPRTNTKGEGQGHRPTKATGHQTRPYFTKRSNMQWLGARFHYSAKITGPQRGQSIGGNGHDSARAKSVPRSLTNPTKPVGFSFQLDARMEARNAEFEKERLLVIEKQKKLHPQPVPVPDFKTLHAAQEADLALRKENILPIIPRPVELNTDSRAREREKFDKMMREKQLELERAMEARRQEAMEIEEREVRELRKKAIPRAHEVPEWYKEAPRRRDRDNGGTIGG
ncbi:hypothetical protein BD779DRAFT_1671460 [Infundibulicybe gibba]|nr:hypothetical protein BD779DRAFT_1671460 [Infundibulicybe gibba]